MKEELC